MISYDTVLQALKDAMEVQGPDFVYSDGAAPCFYRPRDVPMGDPRSRTGCLIGETMKLLGYPPTPEWENISVPGLFREGILPPDDFAEDAQKLLGEVQDRQDVGQPWGDAISNADIKLNILGT